MKPVGPPAVSGPVEQARRVDAVCCEFEARWQRGERPQLEEYVAAARDEDRQLLAKELAGIEAHYRRMPQGEAEDGEQKKACSPPVPTKDTATVNCGGVTPSVAKPGESIDSAILVPGFEVIEELACGGMAVVYRARDLRLNRIVALKVIRAGARANPDDLIRARLEAEAIAALHHPNIVPLHGLVEVEGQPVLVMELLEGGTLQRLLASGPLDPREAARLLELVARGVHHAHQRGIIHRDLKPGNILLDSDGNPKVADFGLAKLTNRDTKVTRANVVVGTPAYMAPEQARNQTDRIGWATDIHALGGILYELLTRKPPFAGDTITQVIRNVCDRSAPQPLRNGARLDRDLETICLKCLNKEPDDRYRTALDLAEDLHRYQSGRPILARPLGRLARAARWVRRHPAPAALLVVFVLGGGLIAVNTINHRVELHRRTKQAEASLDRAEQLRMAALENRHDGSKLAEAEGEAARAELLAESCDSPLQARVQTLRSELHRIRQDRELVRRLEAIRYRRTAVIPSTFHTFDAEPEYVAAFEGSHYLFSRQSAGDVAEQIRTSSLSREILGAVDEWADLRRQSHGAEDPTRRLLLEVIEQSDADPVRAGLRRAIHHRQAQELDRPAESLLAAGLPTPTLCLFAGVVGEQRGSLAAERLLKAIHRRHPDDFGVNYFLGWWFLNKMKPRVVSDATPYLMAALALAPDNPFAHNNLAAVAYDRGDTDDAIEFIKQAILLAPDYGVFHFHAGLILEKMERDAEAEKEYRKAATLKPSFVQALAMVNLSLQCSRRGDKATALRWADQAVIANPAAGIAHLRRSDLLLDARRYTEALEALKRAEKGVAGDASLAATLSHELIMVGLHEEAIRVCRGLLAANDGPIKVRLNLSAALAEVGREEEAVEELRQLAKRQPEYALAHFNLGQSLLLLGRFEEARTSLRLAHKLGSKLPKWPFPTEKLIDDTTRLIGRDEALADMLAGKKVPRDGGEWLDFARCCIGRKDFPAAVRGFREAFRLTPALAADLDEEYRFQAIVAACRAAEAERRKGEVGRKAATNFRQQALTWLQDELVATVELLHDKDPQTRQAVLKHLQIWKQHQGLATLREAKDDEPQLQAAINKFWKSVEDVIATKLNGS